MNYNSIAGLSVYSRVNAVGYSIEIKVIRLLTDKELYGIRAL
jgi:hypothetical protein